MPINSFDYQISTSLNHLCRKYEIFDRMIVMLSDNHLLKGGVLMLIIWYLWYQPGKDKRNAQSRVGIISAFLSSFISIFIVRILPKVMEFRARPILNPDNHFIEPYGINRNIFDNQTSMPSDHCSLFFALATGIFFISRRWGIVAIAYVLLFISFPRLYLGLHYATDILAGAGIGILFAVIANSKVFRSMVSEKIHQLSISHTAVFYMVFFFISYEIVEMFTSLRHIATFMLHPSTFQL